MAQVGNALAVRRPFDAGREVTAEAWGAVDALDREEFQGPGLGERGRGAQAAREDHSQKTRRKSGWQAREIVSSYAPRSLSIRRGTDAFF
jgi:hypothetical protein